MDTLIPQLKYQVEASMEDSSWTWSEQEDLKLDAHVPLVSYSLWDDLVDNEDVVRNLFPPSPLSTGGADIFDTTALPFDEPASLDDNPAPFKRRRILGFDEEDNNSMDMSACLPEPVMSCTDFLVEVCENLQLMDPSSANSTMCLTNEESLSSSVDDAVEQSSESWRVGTPASDDSDTGDAREIAGHFLNPPVCTAPHRTLLTKANRPVWRSGLTTTSTPAMVPCFSPRPSRSNLRMQLPGLIKDAAREKGRQAHPAKRCSSPVLAYPFALVKPTGLQGDVTLQEINERINMVSRKAKMGCTEQQKPELSSPISGKSVVGLTKIHTEGKGTITIMRTKS